MSTPLHMRNSTPDSLRAETVNESRSSRVDIGSINTGLPTNYLEYTQLGAGLDSQARVTDDGRIVVSLDLKKALPHISKERRVQPIEEFAVDKQWVDVPNLSIIIMIVGSRGDVQPYVALGKRLQQDGHRIRIATHSNFIDFVEVNGLEFFDIGGDPQELMAYMVKNPGLLPGRESLMNGDIKRKREMLADMLDGCWRACHSPCVKTGKPFIADAIISNPPGFAHIHCAEALGIPLQMSFTMPWTSTEEFTHPLVTVANSNAKPGMTNILSFAMAELLTWQGVGDLVNDLRTRSLGLLPLTLRSGPGILDRLYVPWTYCMSPALVPKPSDWKDNIDVVGFYFLNLASDYQPSDDLRRFLEAGEAPVYIGFGSVVVEDPAEMSKIIFEATKRVGVRALVSAGWGGLGGISVPSHIYILGDCPHDWLFDNDRVRGIVHHGGAGTTAIGLAKGQPTCVVPFFGDQAFWGSMIHKAGAGPEPIPHKLLDVDRLSQALRVLLGEPAKYAARRMAHQISIEDGVSRGVESFYKHLPLLNMRCDLDPTRVAVWFSVEHCLKMSAFSAQVLHDARLLDTKGLDLHRSKEYDTKTHAKDPILGGAVAIFWMVTNYYTDILRICRHPVDGVIRTTVATPKGVVDILTSISDGMANTPTLYGSTTRKPGARTDWKSGLKEGGKAVFYGYYDGISGLYKTPIAGAKKEGFLGAIKGAARSFADATVKPIGGVFGAISYPVEGAWNGIQGMFHRKQDTTQRQTRIAQGHDAVFESTAEQRQEVIRKFELACQSTGDRQKHLAEMVFVAQQRKEEKSQSSTGSSSTAA